MEKNDKLDGFIEAYIEKQKPIHHLAVDLGIKAFKREAKAAGIPKSMMNRLVKSYKKRSWMEYKGVARHRGTFPSQPGYGKNIEVEHKEEETVINVISK